MDENGSLLKKERQTLEAFNIDFWGSENCSTICFLYELSNLAHSNSIRARVNWGGVPDSKMQKGFRTIFSEATYRIARELSPYFYSILFVTFWLLFKK